MVVLFCPVVNVTAVNSWRILTRLVVCEIFKIKFNIWARAHWPFCLATGDRVFVADPSTLGRHVAATCMLCIQTLCLWRGRATACRTLEPQTAVCSPKLENNGFYGNKYPRHKNAATCG